MMKHHITHHAEGGLMWSSCTCGFESRKLESYHNLQMTQSCMDGIRHIKQMESIEFDKRRMK